MPSLDHIPEDKLARIRKLLERAEHPRTPGPEAENANRRATELLARYGIDRAMIDADNPSAYRVISRTIKLGGTYSYERSLLLGGLAEVLHCDGYVRQLGRIRTQFVIFGAASDIERAEILYNSLVLQALTGMKKAANTGPESLTRFRANWLYGFAGVVVDRVGEIENRVAQEHGPGTELVLADRRSRAKDAVDACDLQESKERSHTGAGVSEGIRAGLVADIGDTNTVAPGVS